MYLLKQNDSKIALFSSLRIAVLTNSVGVWDLLVPQYRKWCSITMPFLLSQGTIASDLFANRLFLYIIQLLENANGNELEVSTVRL